jgi:hypothetical protein
MMMMIIIIIITKKNKGKEKQIENADYVNNTALWQGNCNVKHLD